MDCSKLDNTSNERKIIDMLDFLKKNTKNNNENDLKIILIKQFESEFDTLHKEIADIKKNSNTDKESNKNGAWKYIIEIVSFLLLLGSALAGSLIYLHAQFSSLNNQINNCLTKNDLEDLETSVEEIEKWIDGDRNDKASNPGANSRLEKIETALNIRPINITTSAMLEGITYTTSMENVMAPPPTGNYTLTTYVGEDSEGNEYNIGDIVNETVLLTYIEDGKEIYFLGQINENYHWNGYCVTNVYNSDGTLNGICESNFEDGIRKDYKSFYLSEDNKDEWIHTERTCDENGNLGISIKYSYQCNITKNFTKTNARIYDILYLEDFSDLEDKVMLTYYNGYTLDGKYNDPPIHSKSNDDKKDNNQRFSYEIIYNADRTIGTLYIGQFVGGDFDDNTGEAIEIVFDSSNDINKYFCYKGTFKNGNRTGAKPPYDYVTQTEIDNLIKPANIDPNLLNWYKTE